MRKLQLEKAPRGELLGIVRPWYEEAQAEARAHFLAHQNAERLTFFLASVLDHLIGSLFQHFTGGKTEQMTVVATGGYGRQEQCPYSDIDLLFLYAPSNTKAAAEIAESLLYVLWDMGLKVGQAHRNIEETLMLAHDDMQIRTTLLDARLIAGDKILFTHCMRRLHDEVIFHSALEFVEAKLNERDARHLRFGDSRYVLEPNVKEGKGGLRDLHILWWLARYVYHIESLDDLIGLGHLTQEELDMFYQASQFLLRTRIHLHYQTGHADERLTFDKQLAIARAMGYTNSSPNLAITRFMRRYFISVRTVGSLTRIFCALLEDEKKRKPTKPLGWITLGKEIDHFELDGERLSIKDDQLFTKQPSLMLTLFHVAQEKALDIHPRALRAIARSLHLIDEEFRKDKDACQTFLRILQSDKGPEIALRRMSEAGLLGRFIPEFGRIIGQTQFNMYHAYTVDEHTLMALGILHAVDQGSVKDEVPMASEIMPRVAQKHVLYLALFCHDIAKGRSGDHSELGEHIAVKLGRRFGFTQEECETTAWLVRNHLLLSNTAFKRDLNDPKTISDFVMLVQSPERLKLLLVLTVADIRAVAPGVWNEWKGSLMRDLFNRSMRAMGSGDAILRPYDPRLIRQAILDALPTLDEGSLDHYLSLGSASFLSGCSITQHIAIARMLLIEDAGASPIRTHIWHDEKSFVTEIIICAQNRPGLFAMLTGAIALSGASIIGAKIFTLKDENVVDIFHLQDMAGHSFNRPSMLAKMAVYIEQALAGNLDLPQALLHRAQPYEAHKSNLLARKGAVFLENDASSVSSVIEIAAADRIGLLYDVAHALNELGLSIVTAHISTYGTQAADVFYVKDAFGMKITHPDKIRAVREALAKVL